ncbi:DmsC/YnfH family molybdoenzyme membrane anchor subunit [Edaphobacter bradus]|uniref:DmsC/YnfH family molybdoenzyme membrane anchor subunit n=1 Tax=Edaphobacter bradus TaxID=2259016 RepID=UPI0021DF93B0|nr:DmsC/YnfH family molybdoenzyme membrane anchor subunit [Edaphobacter bradus]
MDLPLLDRATEDGEQFLLTSSLEDAQGAACSVPLVPSRLPLSGEQYRFHLDMTQCIGCKCCVVACNEQNGNPAEIQWRRVGEIEGGVYPDTMRHYLSMGCNHCLEPTCMTGCPVNAYTKDPLTGIVLHSAERCIGCQYCTWNCSYGVPQFNPERGVVGKCDMCYGRLTDGREPACVAACPEEAIRIEIVDIAAWRQDYAGQANAPGLPSADDSISTTRVTVDASLPRDMGRVDTARVEPEHPHWTLILMTVFTQMSVGAIVSMCASQAIARVTIERTPAIAVVMIALFALGVSTMHLGRPIYAFRALSMWRRSWLSREVLFFSLFAAAAVVYALLLWTGARGNLTAGVIAAALGLVAVYCSARLYVVAARPAWNSAHTLFEFYLSAGLTGPLVASLFAPVTKLALGHVAAGCAAGLVLQQLVKSAWFWRSHVFELRASGGLLRYRLMPWFATRLFGLAGLATALTLPGGNRWQLGSCLAISIGLEMLGRYLFFVSVVPKNMAAPYLKERPAA